MAKELIFGLLMAALPAALAAQQDKPAAPKAQGGKSAVVGIPGVVTPDKPVGLAVSSAAAGMNEHQAAMNELFKKKPLAEKVASVDTEEVRAKKKNIFKVLDGKGTGKREIPVKFDKKTHWRILWSAGGETDEVGKFRLRVDAVPAKDSYQEFTKGKKKAEEDSFGALEICDWQETEFKVTLDYDKSHWRLEFQTLAD